MKIYVEVLILLSVAICGGCFYPAPINEEELLDAPPNIDVEQLSPMLNTIISLENYKSYEISVKNIYDPNPEQIIYWRVLLHTAGKVVVVTQQRILPLTRRKNGKFDIKHTFSYSPNTASLFTDTSILMLAISDSEFTGNAYDLQNDQYIDAIKVKGKNSPVIITWILQKKK